jgi:D-glycero-alpha-D-manno-heptose 1-phosphate guanylyltransferase
MADINGKPFLDYQIEEIRKYFPKEKIYLLTHHMSDIIKKYYSNRENIEVIEEKIPMGTGGSIKHAIQHLELTNDMCLLVLNGDTYVKPNFETFIKTEAKYILILASFQPNCSRFGTLKIKNNLLQSFEEKKEECKNSFINAGCYYFKDLTLFLDNDEEVFSLEDHFQKYLQYKPINTLKYNGIFIDIGIPEDYYKMIESVRKDAKN